MRLCPGGGGGGLFLDRVELPPGVSVEGGPDEGGAGGVIHKTHEVTARPVGANHSATLSTRTRIQEGEEGMWREGEKWEGCVSCRQE